MNKRNLIYWGVIVLSLASRASFSEDVLSDAESIVKEAYNGSVKTYLYIGEAVAAIVTMIFSRNIKTLGNLGALIIFVNVVTAITGV